MNKFEKVNDIVEDDAENLENNEQIKDLGTYIKIHKRTALSPEDPEMPEVEKKLEELSEYCKPGLITKMRFTDPNVEANLNNRIIHLNYLDSKKNISACDITLGDIKNFSEIFKSNDDININESIVNEFEKLGFRGTGTIDYSEEEVTIGNYSAGNYPQISSSEKHNYNIIKNIVSSALSEKQERLEKEAKEKKIEEFDL